MFAVASRVSGTVVSVRCLLQGSVPFRVHPLVNPAVRHRGRLSSGFVPFGGSCPCGFTRAAMPGHRRPLGLVTLSTPSSPHRTSRAFFIPVRPWGFPLQGFFLHRVAATFPPMPALVILGRRATNRSAAGSSGLTPMEADTLRVPFSTVGPLPSWGSASPRSRPDRSPRSRAHLLRLSPVVRFRFPGHVRRVASQGHQSVRRSRPAPEPDLREVSQPRRRCLRWDVSRASLCVHLELRTASPRLCKFLSARSVALGRPRGRSRRDGVSEIGRAHV